MSNTDLSSNELLAVKNFLEGKDHNVDPDSNMILQRLIGPSIGPIFGIFTLPKKEYDVKSGDWLIAMTKDFVKDIHKLDRKIQGKILEAITKITNYPLRIVGDTVKPLSGELNGFWRYRIGDFRMIYKPEETSKQIFLICFETRSSVYKEKS